MIEDWKGMHCSSILVLGLGFLYSLNMGEKIEFMQTRNTKSFLST